MLLNFFKMAVRSLRKNYSYTLINILGMAIGLSGMIQLFILYDFEAKFDNCLGNTANVSIHSVR